jgi:hypothetical protein
MIEEELPGAALYHLFVRLVAENIMQLYRSFSTELTVVF